MCVAIFEVSRLTWQRRDSMKSFVQALGGVDLNTRIFSILRKNFVKISWMLVSGTYRRWTQRRDVANIPLRHVATLDSNVATLKTYFSATLRCWIRTSRC